MPEERKIWTPDGEQTAAALREVVEKAKSIHLRRIAVSKAVEAMARQVEPLLRDLGQHHSADRLAAALGEIDAVNAESDAFMKENEAIIRLAVLGGVLRGGI